MKTQALKDKSVPTEKIPLLRPVMPGMTQFAHYFGTSRRAGQFSNFGPCHDLLLRKLELMASCYTEVFCNATIALELACRATWPRGTQVLVPQHTFIASYLAIKNAGMIPRPVKSLGHAMELVKDSKRWHWKESQEPNIGIMPCSEFGRAVDFEKFDKWKGGVVYDMAGAWGRHYEGPHVAVYSLHATKNFAIGEGAVAMSGKKIGPAMMRELSNFKGEGATNAKMSELACAMALAALDEGIPEKTFKERERIYTSYWLFWQQMKEHFPKPLRFIEREKEPGHLSQFVFAIDDQDILAAIETNPVFTAKRYYNPLLPTDNFIPDLGGFIPPGDPRTMGIALPRDPTLTELGRIQAEVVRIFRDVSRSPAHGL